MKWKSTQRFSGFIWEERHKGEYVSDDRKQNQITSKFSTTEKIPKWKLGPQVMKNFIGI